MILPDGNYSLAIQDDSPGNYYPQVCTGFFFARPDPVVIELLEPPSDEGLGCDQLEVNDRLSSEHRSKVKVLDANRFPNGFHWQLDPYIVHFNFCLGQSKPELAKRSGLWMV